MFYGFGTANLKDVIGFDYVQRLIIAAISLVFFGIIYFIVSKRRNMIKNAIELVKKEYWFKHPDFFYTHAFSVINVCVNAQNILSTDIEYDNIVLHFFDMEDFLDLYCSGIKGKILARHVRIIVRKYVLNTLNIKDSRIVMMGV